MTQVATISEADRSVVVAELTKALRQMETSFAMSEAQLLHDETELGDEYREVFFNLRAASPLAAPRRQPKGLRLLLPWVARHGL